MSEFKTCSTCGVVKAVAEFYAFVGICKSCKKSAVLAWRMANPEKVAKTQAAYCKRNAEKVAERKSAWAKKNPGKTSAWSATYRKENPEKVAKCFSIWSNKNAENLASKRAADVFSMTPTYIARALKIPASSLTQELLSLKREQLSTYRLAKQITQAIKAQGASA